LGHGIYKVNLIEFIALSSKSVITVVFTYINKKSGGEGSASSLASVALGGIS
jgi:hypothetical protein